MEHPASTIARDLAAQAERLCRRYLSNGRREGSYWLVGDVRNAPGRSLYVRLRASPDSVGQAGKWTDAESGEHGDLLDIIRAATASGTLHEALREARQFLSLPEEPDPPEQRPARGSAQSSDAANRLLAITRPAKGTLVETYLAGRGLALTPAIDMLRFHPRCWYRRSSDDPPDVPTAMPAMIVPVTDLHDRVTGAHRTWLKADGSDKALVASPRRAMGRLLGNGVRFGGASEIMAAGEGIESILSLISALPGLSAVAALSAAHLGALDFPTALRRLYVARESDTAGHKAFSRLSARASRAGIEVHPLDSEFGDLNADLRAMGREALARSLLSQMLAEDRNTLV